MRLQKPEVKMSNCLEEVGESGKSHTWNLASDRGADLSFRIFQKFDESGHHVTGHDLLMDRFGDLSWTLVRGR